MTDRDALLNTLAWMALAAQWSRLGGFMVLLGARVDAEISPRVPCQFDVTFPEDLPPPEQVSIADLTGIIINPRSDVVLTLDGRAGPEPWPVVYGIGVGDLDSPVLVICRRDDMLVAGVGSTLTIKQVEAQG